ncbi:long-chain-fatty-acid--CoA ligase [Actinoallomurus acaciae]|uniref:Long-chain fatty acid--CoA ligase n=1 Tax=Actinoallomurus acaciae TaxID=502577 RepID=A0ABV5YBU3_9ACTN
MLNLSVVLDDAARDNPDHEALVFGDMRLSYAFVNQIANQVANLLRARGVRPGDKVALACPNLPYFPMVYFGILKAGAVVVPLNVLLKRREIAYHLEDSDAKALFCFEGTPELPLGEAGWGAFGDVPDCEHFFLLPATPLATEVPYGESIWAATAGQPDRFETAQTEATDTAVILYTSGTTGRPKGAELTHQNMLLNAMVCDGMFDKADDDVFLAALPLFHAFGQSVILNTGFLRHATVVLMPRFEAGAALDLMLAEKVTFFAGVPTMYWGLLTHEGGHTQEDIERIAGSLTTASSGGAALPLEVLKGFAERFGVNILEGYGLSETSPVACFNRPDRPARAGSIGRPIWGVEMKLVDDDGKDAGDGPGEIAVRGHCVMKGYLGRPEATAEVLREGWFRTGDIARRDEDGYYFIIDRSKDMIIRGGFNVYPREVEEVLMTHPDVSLAAVVGIAHDTHGEEVKAYVIPVHGATTSEDALIAWARENLANYKYPRVVEFRDELPMTATGKILKRELR